MLSTLLPTPSPRFVYAFQLALALVITYGLALSFDWARPRWAAFAVIAIATPQVGMSLMRGAHRLVGTAVGAVVALFIIALFPQDRWLYILSLSLWMGLCIYMMGFSQRKYLWQCAGFVCGIIAATTANVPGDSFSLAIDRTLETSLGILVYSMVTLLVWRDRSGGEPPVASVPEQYFPDLDQLAEAVRMFLTFWLAFLAIMYIPAFPGGLSFLGPLAGIGIGVISMQQIPARVLHVPVAMALTFASVIYIFVMPHLSGFSQLAPLIFVIGFAVSYYFFGTAKDNIVRLLVLMVFAALTGISNDQVYTFSSITNNVLIFLLVIILLHIGEVVPISLRPEDRFRRLVERFQASASYLSQTAAGGWLAAHRLAFHRHEIATIPGKLKSWRPFLPADLAEPASAALEDLMNNLADCQAQLLAGEQADSPDQDMTKSLAASCAMIDWSAWRQPRF